MYRQELQTWQREAYEQYVNALIKTPTSEKDLVAALEKFVPGSDEYDFLYLITKQKLSGGKFNNPDKKLFQTFLDQQRQGFQELRTRQQFLDYDISDNDKDRDTFIKYICEEALGKPKVMFNHRKPFQMEHQGAKDGEESKEQLVAMMAKATVDQKIFEKNLVEINEISAKSYEVKNGEEYSQIQGHSSILKRMPVHLVHVVNFAIYNPQSVLQYAENLAAANQIAGIENQSFLASIKKGMDAQKKNYSGYTLSRQICDKLSLEQLRQLKGYTQGGTDPNVIGAFFSKQYCDELSKETQDMLTNEEKLNNLTVLYEAAKAQGLPKSLIQELGKQLLLLGPKVNVYNKELFKKFVKHREFEMGGGSITSKIAMGITSIVTDSHQNADWSHIVKNINISDASYSDERSLCALYLEYFAFQSEGRLEEFKNKDAAFLQNYIIENIENRVQIYLSKNGMQGLQANKKITAQLFKQISEEVCLTFLPENKDKFRIQDQVELFLEVKNVSTVHIKVFEFNTLTYYRKTLKPFDTSIDLDGLESTITRKLDFNMPNNCKRKEKFVFDELVGRVGLFIFEFVGNGRSARAVVKKGSLSLIHRSTPAGHLAYIIDDNRQICKGNGTGLWLENKFYAAKEDGSIFINYSKNETSTKVIMVNGDFAQLGEFTRKTEKFQVQCRFYLNEESVLVGGQASIVICPLLTINGRTTSLKLLQNVVATVRTVNYIDQTPTTKKFENLKFNDDSDLSIAFQVPPNLQSIDVALSCQVLNTTTKQMENFDHNQNFRINDYSASNTIHELHLKMTDGNKYELHYLGKNGEPMANVPFDIEFKHAYYNTISQTDHFYTDAQGKIYLGELKKILSISVQGQKSWLLPKLNTDIWHYPREINMLVGGKLEIPVGEMWNPASPNTLDRQQVTFTRSKQGVIIEDWFKKIQVVRKQNQNSHYFLLQVDNLEPGEYDFFLRGEENYEIKINVHQGTYWNNFENFILKRTCIQELVQSQKILKIESSELKSNRTELKLKLADFSKKARVHIFATHFLTPANNTFQTNLKSLMSNSVNSSLFTFAKWTNLLLSDRKLGDEYRYVFDRVHAERTLGNTLDRPSLLNKRLFNRKTEIDQEQLQTGTTFAAQQEAYMPMMQQIMPQAQDRMMGFASLSQNVMPMMQEQYGSHNRRQMEEMDYYGRHSGIQGSIGPNVVPHQVVQNYVTDFQNFIKDAPLIVFNLKPDQDGFVTFKNEKLANYSTLNIIVVDDGQIMQSTRNLQQQATPKKRDLSLKKALNENKGLTESRLHKTLTSGQSDFIEDITSSEIMLVDDLMKVRQIQTEIRKIMNLNHNQTQWGLLDFVMQWQSFNKQTKDFYLGEYQSYELNFFLKRRDTEYFENVVRKFVSNKMEKSFLDHYLLDNDSEILKYTQPGKLTLLNAFEKCLLLEILIRNDKAPLAKSIAKQMRDRVDALNEGSNNRENQNRIFDLVLNMNSTSKQNILIKPSTFTATSASINAPAGLGGGAWGGIQSNEQSVGNHLFMDDQMEGECEEVEKMNYENFDLQQDSDDDDDSAANSSYGQEEAKVFRNRNQNNIRKANMSTEKFEQLEATCEYMETFYYDSKAKSGTETLSLISENAFWCDYADFIVSKQSNFITPLFSECIDFRQSFFSQCLLDLNTETQASAHQYQADDSRGVTIVAGSNLIVFKKEIKEVEVNLKQNFMVTHRYHRIDKYGLQNTSVDDDAIPKEFLVNVPYECEVIMTNVSPYSTDFNLLYQIPIGSMPMKKTKYMKSEPLSLSPYSTKKLSFFFYFPTTGQLGHYPSNVSIGETVSARGQFNTLNVVKRRNISKDQADELNFDDLVQVGTKKQILDYLQQKNLYQQDKGFSFSKILYLMQEKDFWLCTIQILRQRSIYVQEIWAYACYHKTDIQALREFIMTSRPGYNIAQISRCFTSSLYVVDPKQIKKEFFKMLEYNPMVNARAHKVGMSGSHQILNKTFRQTFDAYLQTMAFKHELEFEDKLIYVYYLQLQDRIPEAIALFNNLDLPQAGDVEGDMATLEMQYDYLSAYFDFFTGQEDGYKTARRVVQRYDNYPISNWKLMFLAIQDQLDEFDGEFDQMQSEYDSESVVSGSQASLLEKKQENMKNSKSKEPNLAHITIDSAGTITVETVNIRNVVVKYYMIDAEVLFSRAPFLKNNTEEFSYVKPCIQTVVQMREPQAEDELMTQFITKDVPLPTQLKNQNLVIEINGEGQQEFRTFYSCALKVQINEAFGELKVMHNEKALGQVYVKVFMQNHSKQESFYRDGYTDIRGKFEYAVTSGDSLKSVAKFSILIQSAEHGSQIKEVNPPKDEQIQAAPVGQSSAQAKGGDYAQPQQVQSSLAYAKQERMVNRCNWVNSKKK